VKPVYFLYSTARKQPALKERRAGREPGIGNRNDPVLETRWPVTHGMRADEEQTESKQSTSGGYARQTAGNGEPCRAPVPFDCGKLIHAGLEQGARAGCGRYLRIVLLLVNANEIQDSALQFLAAHTAFPACVKMCANGALIARRKLPLNIEEQLLIGKM
jgi:hypothetical protein